MIRNARNRRTIKDIAHLASGTAFAQAAPLLATPLLARLYAPVRFAELGIFSAMLLGLSLVISGRYEMAVPLPESAEEAEDVLLLSVLVSAVGSVLLLVACALAGALFGGVLRSKWGVTPPSMLALPVAVFAAAVSQSCGYWFTRVGDFRLVGRARAAQGLVTAGSGVLFGVMGMPWGLVMSLALGSMVSAGWLAWVLLRVRPEVLITNRSALRSAAIRFRHFPLVNGPHVLLDTLRETGTLFAFGALFGPVATAFLSQSLRILRAPMTLIGQAVAQVYFPRASRERAAGRSIRSITRTTAFGVLAVSVPVYIGVALGGPWLFSLLLGPQWAEVGTYARTLAPWLGCVLVVSSLSMLPIICDAQPQALGLNVAETTVRLAAIVLGGMVFGIRGALVGMAIGGLTIAMVQLTWYWRLSSDRRVQPEIRQPESAAS